MGTMHAIHEHLVLSWSMLQVGLLTLAVVVCRVLPTSAEDGLIECVPSMALARVLAEHKSIHRYWALYNADPSGAESTSSSRTRACCLHCTSWPGRSLGHANHMVSGSSN